MHMDASSHFTCPANQARVGIAAVSTEMFLCTRTTLSSRVCEIVGDSRLCKNRGLDGDRASQIDMLQLTYRGTIIQKLIGLPQNSADVVGRTLR